MTAHVSIRRMTLAKASIVVFVVVALLTTVFMLKMSQGEAAPSRPDRPDRGPSLLRAVAELGPQPADAARRDRHHQR